MATWSQRLCLAQHLQILARSQQIAWLLEQLESLAGGPTLHASQTRHEVFMETVDILQGWVLAGLTNEEICESQERLCTTM